MMRPTRFSCPLQLSLKLVRVKSTKRDGVAVTGISNYTASVLTEVRLIREGNCVNSDTQEKSMEFHLQSLT